MLLSHYFLCFWNCAIIWAQDFPDYYEGVMFTHNNGTMEKRTSIKIQASDKEYNKIYSLRDNRIKGYLDDPQMITIPLSHYNEVNEPPVNVSGKVCTLNFVCIDGLSLCRC